MQGYSPQPRFNLGILEQKRDIVPDFGLIFLRAALSLLVAARFGEHSGSLVRW